MQPSMQNAARVAAALGETSRVAIVSALLEREATVSDLASRLNLAQPRVSTHLARLRTAGLVTSSPPLARARSCGGESTSTRPAHRAGDSRPRVSTGLSANRIWAAH